MGTLFSQPERDPRYVGIQEIDDFLADAAELAAKHRIGIADVIAAKHALELQRQNTLAVKGGDALDEQLAGFGELVRELTAAIKGDE